MANIKRWLVSFFQVFIVVVLMVGLFRYVIIPVRVEGTSMENTFLDNDLALINKIGVNEKNIERFDVVIAYSEELNEMVIKRVIGLPHDSLRMQDDVLYINGEVYQQDFLDEEFVKESMALQGISNFTSDFEICLDDDEYFLMGDNRPVSLDSRVLGPFHIDDIKGCKGIVIYPFNRIQWFV